MGNWEVVWDSSESFEDLLASHLAFRRAILKFLYHSVVFFCIPGKYSHPKVFLGKSVLKICSKFTGEDPCKNVISIKLLSNLIEITLWHGSSPVNLLHIFRTPLLKNTSGRLLLKICPAFFMPR